MTQELFQRHLSCKIWTKRIILLVLAAILITLGIVYGLYAESVNGSLCGIITASGSLVALLFFYHLLYCRHKTFTRGEQNISLCRGMFINIVYVDGIEKGRCLATRHHNLVEVWLKERVRASVNFTKSPLNLAYISFSDHSATIEL